MVPFFISTEKKANLNLSKLGAEEYPVVTSAIFSLEIMSKIFDKTEQEFLDSAKSDVKALAGSKIYIEKLKYKNTKIKKTGPGSGQGSEGMSPGGLIEGWVVSEEMNLEQLNKKQADSIVLKMLKSDFLLDLTENTIKHQK